MSRREFSDYKGRDYYPEPPKNPHIEGVAEAVLVWIREYQTSLEAQKKVLSAVNEERWADAQIALPEQDDVTDGEFTLIEDVYNAVDKAKNWHPSNEYER